MKRIYSLLIISLLLVSPSYAEKAKAAQWSSELPGELTYIQALPEISANVMAHKKRIQLKFLEVELVSELPSGEHLEVKVTDHFSITPDGRLKEHGKHQEHHNNKNSAFTYHLDGDFSALADGKHVFNFFAKDVSGKEVKPYPFVLEFVKDSTAPIISSSTLGDITVSEELFTIDVSVTDLTNTSAQVLQNGLVVFESSEKNFTYSATLVDGVNNFVIKAVDQVSNVAPDFLISNVELGSSVAEVGEVNPGDTGLPVENIVVTELAEDPPEIINNIFVPISPLVDVSDSAHPEGIDFNGKFLTIEFSYDRDELLAKGLNEVFQVLYRDTDGAYKAVAFTQVDSVNQKIIAFTDHLTPFVATAVNDGAAPVIAISPEGGDLNIFGGEPVVLTVTDDSQIIFDERILKLNGLAIDDEYQTIDLLSGQVVIDLFGFVNAQPDQQDFSGLQVLTAQFVDEYGNVSAKGVAYEFAQPSGGIHIKFTPFGGVTTDPNLAITIDFDSLVPIDYSTLSIRGNFPQEYLDMEGPDGDVRLKSELIAIDAINNQVTINFGGEFPFLLDTFVNIQVAVQNENGNFSSSSVTYDTRTSSPTLANFDAVPDSGVSPLQVNFDASASSSPMGAIIEYRWLFGDEEFDPEACPEPEACQEVETVTTDPLITHTYSGAGNF